MMKKGITILICAMLISITSAMAQDIDINASNFPDANFRNYLLGRPEGYDAILTPAEISGAINIDVYSLNVSDLTGIGFFTAMYSLYCNNNQLTSLDVSSCTALNYLDCNDNQLTSLDVSGCTALEYLYCNRNQLTSLDVSSNTAMYALYCNNNQLTSLDVSSNTAMYALYCNNNQLTSLDVSSCTALHRIECHENKLPFSELYTISKIATLIYKQFGLQQLSPVSATVGAVVDWSPLPAQNVFDGIYTTYDVRIGTNYGGPVASTSDYTVNNGNITFNTAGTYTVIMKNEAIVCNASPELQVVATITVSDEGGGDDPSGEEDCMEVKWAKNFGGSDIDNYNSVITVSDGTVAVGYSAATSFGNGDWTGVTGKGQTDAIIVKYDNDGNAVWKKNFGGSTGESYNSVTTVSDGIVAVGYAASSSLGTGDWTGITGYGENDAIIVKYDNDGNIIWKKNFGGFAPDYYLSVTAVSDGIVAVGYSMGGFGSGDLADLTSKGDIDAIIVKYDNDGNVIWKKNFGGSGGNQYLSVIAVSDGVVAVGLSYEDSFGNGDWIGVTGRGGVDAIIVKYDNDGNVLWKKNFGGSESDHYRDVTTVSDGIVAVGYSYEGSFGNGDWTGVTGKGNDDAIIVKYDNDGNVVWKKCIGGIALDSYEAVIAVSDGVVAVGTCFYTSLGTGDWESITGKGNGADAVIVKHDNSGNIVWIKSFGGYDNDFYHSVTAVSNGIVAVGHYTDLSPGTGDLEDIQGKGSWDAIIVKYSSCDPIEDCEPITNILNLPTCTSIGNMALIGMITPTNATNQNIIWSVTGAGASITGTNNDILTTTSTGSVTVRATISDGLCGSDYTQDFNINVLEAVTGVTYTPGIASTGNPFTLGVGLSVTPSTVTDYVIAWQVVNAGTTGAKIGGNILKATAGGTVTVRVYIIHNACGHVMFTKDYSITVNDGCCN